jgi:dTDP-4-dehydrorhamnose 3,5-epimerase-like enzyme
MFDKVMESISIMNLPQMNLLQFQNKEAKIAAVCLYMASKFEDPKYPFFECYRKIWLEKTKDEPEFYEQILSFSSKNQVIPG